MPTTLRLRDPWAPYEPTEADPWDLRKVAHLHRRAGFGATWDELQRDLERGPTASIDGLLDPPPPSDNERRVVEALQRGAVWATDIQRLKASWLYRMRFGHDPLRETMTLFWHDHFATSNLKVKSVTAMAEQVEMIRKHALGPFDALLRAMIADDAMLVWLDGGSSKKTRPNENFAREFLELFTLGPGHYTEVDIREAARAFTGWTRGRFRSTPNDLDPEFVYDSTDHDDGSKTFLGQTGPWEALDIVRITLEQPDAAEFLAAKLYRQFIDESTEPTRELLEPLAHTLRSGGYAIAKVLEMILRSRLFFSAKVHRRRVKSPVAHSLGLVRMLEIPRSDLNLLIVTAACDRQGQELFAPPNVDGWPGGTTWIQSASLLERLNWSTDVIWGNPEYGLPPFDPIAWATSRGLAPENGAGAFATLLLQDDLDPKAKALVLEAGRAGSPDGLRKALQRMLHAPEFQLA